MQIRQERHADRRGWLALALTSPGKREDNANGWRAARKAYGTLFLLADTCSRNKRPSDAGIATFPYPRFSLYGLSSWCAVLERECPKRDEDLDGCESSSDAPNPLASCCRDR